MVLDAVPQSAKGGIEEQARKLFELCRLRDVPILTFVNKLDRESRDPFDLLDEVEQSLALDVTPASWPIGMGRNFLGPYDLFADALLLFERGVHDRVVEPVRCSGLDDPKLPRLLPKAALAKLREEVEMAKGLCPPFDPEAYREGHLTPVYFGSALNNFGVRELLRGVAELARRRARSRPKGPMDRGRSPSTSLRSPASCSRYRPIWTRSTATASPLCGSPRPLPARHEIEKHPPPRRIFLAKCNPVDYISGYDPEEASCAERAAPA
jgi:translation elongation factor EF-G